jgi:hypothetical protein
MNTVIENGHTVKIVQSPETHQDDVPEFELRNGAVKLRRVPFIGCTLIDYNKEFVNSNSIDSTYLAELYREFGEDDVDMERVKCVTKYWMHKQVDCLDSVPRINNRNSEWLTGKSQSNDRYKDVGNHNVGVKFLKDPKPSLSQLNRLKKIYPRVCKGDFSLEILEDGFRNVNRTLFALMWHITSQEFDYWGVCHLTQFFEKEKALKNLKSSPHDYVERRTDSLVYFLKNYKLLLSVFCGKSTNSVERRITKYLVDSSRFKRGTTLTSTKTIVEDKVVLPCQKRKIKTPKDIRDCEAALQKDKFESQMFSWLQGKTVEMAAEYGKKVVSEIASDAQFVKATAWSAMGSFFGELPGKISECITNFGVSAAETIRSIVDYLYDFFVRVRDSFLSGLSLVSEAIDGSKLMVFGVCVGIFVLILSFSMAAKAIAQLSKIATSVAILTFERIGYPIRTTDVHLLDKMLGNVPVTRTCIESQSLGSVMPLLASAMGIAISCTDKGASQNASAALNFAQKLPQVVQSVEDAFSSCLDFLYMKLYGVHWIADREHFDDFENFITRYTEFLKIPKLDESVLCNMTTCGELKLLVEHANRLEPMLMHMKANPTMQNALVKAFVRLRTLNDYAKDRADYYKTRIETPLLWLHGESGQGKTTVLEHIVAAVYKHVKDVYPESCPEPWSRSHMYHRDRTSQYWEGYKQQFACVWNEAFEKKEARERARVASELLTACEDGTYPLDMAFEQKGKAFFNSSIAVVSSNLTETELEKYCGLTAPEALVRRRTLYLEVIRDKDFDPEKGNFDEAWQFILVRPKTPQFQKSFDLGTPVEYKKMISSKGYCMLRFSDVVATFADEITTRMARRTEKTTFMREFDYVKYVARSTSEPSSSEEYEEKLAARKVVEKKKEPVNKQARTSRDKPNKDSRRRALKEKVKEHKIDSQMWAFTRTRVKKPIVVDAVSNTREFRNWDIMVGDHDSHTSTFREIAVEYNIKSRTSSFADTFKLMLTKLVSSADLKARRSINRIFRYLCAGQIRVLRREAVERVRQIFRSGGVEVPSKTKWSVFMEIFYALRSSELPVDFESFFIVDLFFSYWHQVVVKETNDRWNSTSGAKQLKHALFRWCEFCEIGENKSVKATDMKVVLDFLKFAPTIHKFEKNTFSYVKWQSKFFSLESKWAAVLRGTVCPFLTKYGHWLLVGFGAALALALGMVGMSINSRTTCEVDKTVVPPAMSETTKMEYQKKDKERRKRDRKHNHEQHHYTYADSKAFVASETSAIFAPVFSQSLPQGENYSLPKVTLPVVSHSLPQGENYTLPKVTLPVVSQSEMTEVQHDRNGLPIGPPSRFGIRSPQLKVKPNYLAWPFSAYPDLDEGVVYRMLTTRNYDGAQFHPSLSYFKGDEWNSAVIHYVFNDNNFDPMCGRHSGPECNSKFNDLMHALFTAPLDELSGWISSIKVEWKKFGFNKAFFKRFTHWLRFSSQSDTGMQVGAISHFMRVLRVWYGDNFSDTHGLIGGRRFLAPAHFFSALGYNFTKLELINNGVTTFTCLPSQVNLTLAPKYRDLVYLDFSPKVMNAQMSIRGKLYADEEEMSSKMNLESEFSRVTKTIMANGSIVIERVRRNGAIVGTSPVTENQFGKLDIKNYYVLAGALGEAGDCGQAYTHQDSTNVLWIVGTHAGRSGYNSYFVPVFQYDFPLDGFHSQAYVPKWLKYITPEISPPTWTGKYIYMGQAKKKKIIPNKTNFRATPAQGDYNMGGMYPLATMPALLTPTNVNGVDVFPLQNAMKKLGRSPLRPMQDWMVKLVEQHPDRIFDGFFPKKMNYGAVRPWTIEEVLFGIPGVWKGLTQDTAIGYDMECISNYKSRKEIWNCNTGYISPILRQLVEDLEQAVRDGKMPKNVVAGCLKDEPRDLERVASGATRLFCIGSLSHLVWTVKWMGALVSEMKRARSTSDVAIGTNVFGHDWKNLMKKLERFGKASLFGGGDFGDYDTSQSGWFGWALGEACTPFYRLPKGSWQENCVRFACQSSLCPILVVGSQLYWFDFYNPSGNWLTGFLNSFVNIFIFNALFFYLQATSNDLDFQNKRRQDVLSLSVYGDDNIWALLKYYAKYFDMIKLSELIHKFFGMKYTTASKGAVTEPFVLREEVEFLKRRFVPVGSMVHAPLSEESIHSMLNWIQKPNPFLEVPVTFEEQFLINVEVACSEWFQHGREVFESETEHMRNYIAKNTDLRWSGYPYSHYLERWVRTING